ncbi:hypothetical protein [Kitasatospora sp. NPDC001683]
MTALLPVPGTVGPSVSPVELVGASTQARASIIESEIVIVDDEGNEEPYDPTRH